MPLPKGVRHGAILRETDKGATAIWSADEAIRHFLLLVATVLAACTSSSSSTSPPGAASLTSGPSAIELKVMEFNIEYGGEEVDFASVPKAILASGADVVAVEEAWANMPRIAQALGWGFYDPRMQIVSRYPLPFVSRSGS